MSFFAAAIYLGLTVFGPCLLHPRESQLTWARRAASEKAGVQGAVPGGVFKSMGHMRYNTKAVVCRQNVRLFVCLFVCLSVCP